MPHAVPKNLWRFLSQARQLRVHFSGWLWIDALSIQQSNPLEKHDQVKIISQIFESAEQVFVWLGPAYAMSDEALRQISAGKFHSSSGKTHYQKILAGPAGSAIRSLCDRKYWRRLWVFQELKAARRTQMMCGNMLLPLEAFESFLRPLLLEDSSVSMPRLKNELETLKLSPAAEMIQLLQVPMDKSLWSWLQETSHLDCANPRDKVYALLSVAVKGHEGIEPDYQRELPDLLDHTLDEQLKIVRLQGAGELNEYCSKLQSMFGSAHSDLLYWETLAKRLRPSLG
jgi:hypothetical protein